MKTSNPLFFKSRLTIAFIFLLLEKIQAQNNPIKKPNVIVIYTGDQGAVDLGCYGSKDIYSPNLDKLAKEGPRFTQAYVAAPFCAPSRAALFTEKYPQNAGVSKNTSAAPDSHGLPKGHNTIATLFKANKYPDIVKELIADFISWEHGSDDEVPKKQQEIIHLGRKGMNKNLKKELKM